MERPIQKSVTDIDVSCFDTSKNVRKFRNLFYLKNPKIDLTKLILYDDSNIFDKVENKTIPYFTTKMILEETCKYSHQQISEIIDFYGVSLKSLYGKDACQVSMLLMPKDFNEVFDVFHEVICSPKFTEERLEHVRNIDLQNLEVENSNNKNVIGKEFLKLLFGEDSLYGYFRCVEDINKITITDLKSYFESSFRENWKCIIAGNVNDDMLNCTSDNFDPILLHDVPEYIPNEIHNFDLTPKKKVIEKGSQQEYLCMGKICIPSHHKDYLLLWCCVMFWGGYFGSRLMTNIRERGGYTYGIRASLNSMKKCSYLCIKSSLKKGYSETIIDEIRKEIEILQHENAPSDELYSFKQYFIGEMMSEISNPFVPVAQFQSLDTNRLDKNFYSKLAKTIIDLSSEQIMTMAQKYLTFDSMSTVILK